MIIKGFVIYCTLFSYLYMNKLPLFYEKHYWILWQIAQANHMYMVQGVLSFLGLEIPKKLTFYHFRCPPYPNSKLVNLILMDPMQMGF